MFAGRLALWATARVEERGPGPRPWCIVDDASNPVDTRACVPGRTVTASRLARQQLDRDGALVPPGDTWTGNPAGAVEELRFSSRDEAQARLVDERRKAAWIVLHGLLVPLPGNLDDLHRRTADLYRSLCLDETSPDVRRRIVVHDRLSPDRCDCHPSRDGQ